MKHIVVLVIFSLLLTGCASTEENRYSESSFNSSAYTHEDSHFGQARVIKYYASNPNIKKIKAFCYISNNPEDFFETPCKDVTFVLINRAGAIVSRTQADDNGRFQFLVERGKRYTLTAESNQYKTASHTIQVSAGAELLIRLIKK